MDFHFVPKTLRISGELCIIVLEVHRRSLLGSSISVSLHSLIRGRKLQCSCRVLCEKLCPFLFNLDDPGNGRERS